MIRNRWILLLVLFTFRFELFSQTEVLFSHYGGFYDEPFVLSLGCTDWNCQVHYTTNGNSPTASSALYETPLFLDERLYSSSDIYTLPVSPLFEPFQPESVKHAIVIRAAAFDGEGKCVSDVVTQTYLIRSMGCDHHGLAVVSVCCDSLSLFDYNTGILVPGVYYDPEEPETTGNYFQRGMKWERLANVEFYLNTFLLYSVILRMQDGVYEIGEFLGYYFIRKCMWSTPDTIKSTAASIKKFYKSMLSHGLIDSNQYRLLADTIKDNMREWQEECARYNDPDK